MSSERPKPVRLWSRSGVPEPAREDTSVPCRAFTSPEQSFGFRAGLVTPDAFYNTRSRTVRLCTLQISQFLSAAVFLDFESGIVSATVYRRNMSFRARWVWIFLRVQQRFNWNEDFNLNGRWQKVVHNSGMQLMIALAVIWKKPFSELFLFSVVPNLDL